MLEVGKNRQKKSHPINITSQERVTVDPKCMGYIQKSKAFSESENFMDPRENGTQIQEQY